MASLISAAGVGPLGLGLGLGLDWMAVARLPTTPAAVAPKLSASCRWPPLGLLGAATMALDDATVAAAAIDRRRGALRVSVAEEATDCTDGTTDVMEVDTHTCTCTRRQRSNGRRRVGAHLTKTNGDGNDALGECSSRRHQDAIVNACFPPSTARPTDAMQRPVPSATRRPSRLPPLRGAHPHMRPPETLTINAVFGSTEPR